ncbi:MAG TPA: D-2-hydroxyacid dehydrogenase [Vicinamibacterales bacterium]|nr:D-2-hydroxyacid dehydrogenase [Vicinamibacterales bacterium]
MKVLVGIYSPFAAWNIPAGHVARLQREFPAHRFLHAVTEADMLPLIGEAEAAYTSELRPEHFSAAPRLRWVHSPAAGVGAMLFPALIESPVVISNSRGMSADPIAEHVIGLALALFRKFPLAFRSQAVRHWAQDEAIAPPPLRSLQSSHVLIVGLGRIGAACAWRFAALGATVSAVRRRLDQPVPPGVGAVGAPDRLPDLLRTADLVVLTAAQTRETHGLIGEPELRAMKPDAMLINVSRGKLVDEAALARALAQGTIGGAGLDVFEHEPLDPASPLWAEPNVIITPHMSGFRPDHWDAATALFAENLRRFDAGQPLLNVVDKTAGY